MLAADANVGQATVEIPQTVRRIRGADRSDTQPSRVSRVCRQTAAAGGAIHAAAAQGYDVRARGQQNVAGWPGEL